ncbi:hypothetical protein JW865_02045 [Candidatus Bathyarchaeota archaeon]|nr:hypothetical protein [Candidatus Bathyarchaeota archaeon]
MTNISINEIIGKKTLIIGDVGTGKTRLSKDILEQMIKKYPYNITVVDFAPEQTIINKLKIGGKLIKSPTPKIRILNAEGILPPRLLAKKPEEVIKYSKNNNKIIEKIFGDFLATSSKVLFINDVSIYLQTGNFNRLWNVIQKSETVVINGYLGDKLNNDYNTGISLREKQMMIKLSKRMDKVILLGKDEFFPETNIKINGVYE